MKRLFAPLLVLLLAACASFEDAKPPSIQLSNMRLGTAGLLSQEILLEIRIGNPNDFALPLTGMTFQLDVNGQPLVEGLSNTPVTVPRLGYAVVPVTGSAGMLGILRQLLSLGARDKIEYRLYGTAYVAQPGRDRAVAYDRSGALSLLPDTAPDRRGDGRTLVPIGR